MDRLVPERRIPLAALRRKTIAVLPDLYVDALATLPAWSETREQLSAIAERGGGNLPVGPIEVKLGGNAANLAIALARLGARTTLIAETDVIGRLLLERAAAGTALDTEGVRIGRHGSTTLGLECLGANVMLSHAGPLTDFGPERLTKADWSRLAEADAVAIVNWSQNRRGTALVQAVTKRLAPSGTFIYFDSGDPRHRIADARALFKGRPWWGSVGAIAMNENELGAFTGRTLAAGDLAAAASRLAGEVGTRIDLHTRTSATTVVPGGAAVTVKGLRGRPRRLTGAGDAWNAGNLAGHVMGWADRDRLRLAHKVATLYVTGASGLPPTARQADGAIRPSATTPAPGRPVGRAAAPAGARGGRADGGRGVVAAGAARAAAPTLVPAAVASTKPNAKPATRRKAMVNA